MYLVVTSCVVNVVVTKASRVVTDHERFMIAGLLGTRIVDLIAFWHFTLANCLYFQHGDSSGIDGEFLL